jgi:imidazolonepropionase-like amidohydrolase
VRGRSRRGGGRTLTPGIIDNHAHIGQGCLPAANFDDYYVTAKNKKYFVLRDSENVPLAPAANSGGDIYSELAAAAAGPGGQNIRHHPPR